MNIKSNRMRFSVFIIMNGFFLIQKVVADTKIVDRMIVKIKGESHSQWEIESYSLVKQSLELNDKKKLDTLLKISSQAQWQKTLAEYIDHVLILEQIQKRGGGVVDKTLSANKFMELKDLVQTHSTLKLWYQELGLTEKQLKKQIHNLLVIEANKSSQIRRSDNIVVDSSSMLSKLSSQGEIHYYQDALTYEPIRK